MLAQYGGGNGRGDITATVNSNPLGDIALTIYRGGNGRGEMTATVNNNPLGDIALTIYTGGNGRGEITAVVNSSPIGDSALSIYRGGNGRGETINWVNNNQLNGTVLNLFGGGNGRGETYKSENALQLDGTSAVSMFLGGTGRGENARSAIIVALPVTLMSFSAAQAGKEIKIQWQTSSELNSAFFIVEKSPDGRSWQSIGKVNAAGQSATPVAYQFFDTNPQEGINYYRLKPTDKDGQFTYSPVAAVHFHAGAESAIIIYPNPVKYQFTVKIQGSQSAGRLHISMVNAQGQIIFDKPGLSGNTQIFNIANIPGGTYFLVADNNGQVTTTKIVKE